MEKRERPHGWGKAYVLDRLKAGERLEAICANAAAGLDTVVARTLKGDVLRWCRQDPEFRAYYRELAPKRSTTRAPFRGSGNWKLDWGKQYLAKNGDLAAAARAVGVSPIYVYACLNPNDKGYDPTLAQIRASADTLLLAQTEGILRGSVAQAWEAGDYKTAGFLADKILEKLDRAKWGREQRVVMSGSVEHHHTISREERLLAAAEDQRAYFERVRTVSSLPPAPADAEVIEGVVVER